MPADRKNRWLGGLSFARFECGMMDADLTIRHSSRNLSTKATHNTNASICCLFPAHNPAQATPPPRHAPALSRHRSTLSSPSQLLRHPIPLPWEPRHRRSNPKQHNQGLGLHPPSSPTEPGPCTTRRKRRMVGVPFLGVGRESSASRVPGFDDLCGKETSRVQYHVTFEVQNGEY